jgi:hypothetical protein
MRTIKLLLLIPVLFLSACACNAPLEILGQGNRVGFRTEEPYRIAMLEVAAWSRDGERKPTWRIENAEVGGVYYATHSPSFETTFEPSRLDFGVYSVRFECTSENGKRCKREQLFAITAPDGLALECKTRQQCQSLVLDAVTAR